MENELRSIITVHRMEHGSLHEAEDAVAREEPLQIQLLFGPSGKEQIRNLAVTMRTPGNDQELAAGFLFSEGILQHNSQVISIVPEASGVNTVLVALKGNVTPNLGSAERNFYMTSSCGVCGKSSIDAVRTTASYPTQTGDLTISPALLTGLPDLLQSHQPQFQRTGGLHASALFHRSGELETVREDVGRHNALDKIIGAAFLKDQLPLGEFVLLLSGRASFELIQKAAVAGIRIIAAIGAPSSLAVELAAEAGITLIGFLKSERFNIYTHPHRVVNEGTDHENTN